MVKFCTACGAANPPDSRFCGKCGTSIAATLAASDVVTEDPAPETPKKLIESVPDDKPSFSDMASEPLADAPKRPWIVPAAITATLIVITALYYWLFLADDMRESAGDPEVSTEAGTSVEAKAYFAMTEANVRDKPTTVDSSILGKMPRGSQVTGVVKLGADGKSSWLELTDGKGFIAMVNLAESEPPEITKALNDKIWVADATMDIWSTADISGNLLERVSEGTKLTLSGLTANDFIEVKLPKGGVGYLADGAAILARLGGKPVAISFNPQRCSFGGELDAEFTKIGNRLRAQWQALEDKEFVDDEARQKAYAASEGKSTFVKLQRSFEGLSLTAIAQHYESQSVYFADPPSKVIDVFRSKGLTIGGDGTFPASDFYAAISATRGEGAAYGKSELGCGV
jgi:uncharacterized protein YgiM (DUF1202 family)